MHPLVQALVALVPSVGVGLLFWLALRSIIQADRRERIALARLDAQDSARGGAARSTESR